MTTTTTVVVVMMMMMVVVMIQSTLQCNAEISSAHPLPSGLSSLIVELQPEA
jgi:hypothetical protein